MMLLQSAMQAGESLSRLGGIVIRSSLARSVKHSLAVDDA